jgi:hypothetical protein
VNGLSVGGKHGGAYDRPPTVRAWLRSRVGISDSGVRLDLAVNEVEPRFRGDLALEFKTTVSDDVLTALLRPALAFNVAPEYVFHMLGVRVN